LGKGSGLFTNAPVGEVTAAEPRTKPASMLPFRRKSPHFSTKRKKALAASISSSNNAGIMQQGLVSVADTDDALFDRLFAINVKGTFNTLRLAAKRLRQGGRGGIVTNHKTGKGCRAFTSPLFALNPSPLKSLFTLDRRGKLKKSSAAQSEYFSMRARRRMAFCGITRSPCILYPHSRRRVGQHPHPARSRHTVGHETKQAELRFKQRAKRVPGNRKLSVNRLIHGQSDGRSLFSLRQLPRLTLATPTQAHRRPR
jgi:short chain dehydrogenase